MKRFRLIIALAISLSSMFFLPSCDVLLQGLTSGGSSSNTTNNNGNNNSNSSSSTTTTSGGNTTSKGRQ